MEKNPSLGAEDKANNGGQRDDSSVIFYTASPIATKAALRSLKGYYLLTRLLRFIDIVPLP